jgi:hypothetical protein
MEVKRTLQGKGREHARMRKLLGQSKNRDEDIAKTGSRILQGQERGQCKNKDKNMAQPATRIWQGQLRDMARTE